MKTIGFIDYYLSEWHADHYPAWIGQASKKLGLDYAVKYAWGERETSPVTGLSNAEWCEKFGVTLCGSAAEVCEKSDFLIVLAPSNPEVHLRLAEAVLPYGKPTYIDKTFAPDLKTAQAIFDLAAKYNTPFFSTSALRCAAELDGVADADAAIFTGGGRLFDEYIIHQVEMAVKILGVGATAVRRARLGGFDQCRIFYPNGKNATLSYAPPLPFSATYRKGDQWTYAPIESDMFGTLLENILKFFETKQPFFDTNETLEVMKIREALVNCPDGETIKL